jgi:hypothetical protein
MKKRTRLLPIVMIILGYHASNGMPDFSSCLLQMKTHPKTTLGIAVGLVASYMIAKKLIYQGQYYLLEYKAISTARPSKRWGHAGKNFVPYPIKKQIVNYLRKLTKNCIIGKQQRPFYLTRTFNLEMHNLVKSQ